MMGHFTAQDKHYFKGVSDENLYAQFKKAIPNLTLDKSQKIETQKNEEIRIINETHNGELKEKLEAQDELIKNLALSLASTKHLFYEKSYEECYENGYPNLDKLRIKMTPDEIRDWNSIVPLLNKPDWVIKDLNNSEVRMKHIKELKEWRSLLEDCRKQGESKKVIESIENKILKIVEEYDLDKKKDY